MTFIKAMNNIDDKYLEEAMPGKDAGTVKKADFKKNVIRYFPALAGVAAVAVLALTVGLNRNRLTPGEEVMVAAMISAGKDLEDEELKIVHIRLVLVKPLCGICRLIG